ncbi:MAG: Zn-dependent hydrolase [Gammaproteobacteria bacterium]
MKHFLINRWALITFMFFSLSACSKAPTESVDTQKASSAMSSAKDMNKDSLTLLDSAKKRLDIYATFALKADISSLSDSQKEMLPLLIEASKIMDELYWRQAYGPKKELLSQISDPKARRFAEINYGPWDRLAADNPMFKQTRKKPLGAQFYPADMSKEEFEKTNLPGKVGLYSLIKRVNGALTVVPYHEEYAAELAEAASLLRQASKLADDSEFANYLMLRAQALITDEYQPSDMAWMDMKNNSIDLVIGAIETYEDLLFGYRTSYESYVLIKDLEWSDRLSRYASFLPELQRGLPVPAEYKQETPGGDSDLNAYDVIYYAGHSNAGSKTIAINLPNDEEVQLAKGTRRLQLKNAMRAKFDKILVPISGELIVPEQRKHITFDAFFANTMFHEVAHGLGVKNTLDGTQTARVALKELASATEEGKADVLGLYMVTKLFEKGEIPEGELMDNYVTFLASIFRSIRFGATSAHGKANMVRFNFFEEMGAFNRNSDGQYQVNFDKMQAAMNALSRKILMLQGNGDYAGTKAMIEEDGNITKSLQSDLDRLSAAGIPVDIVFDQGVNYAL